MAGESISLYCYVGCRIKRDKEEVQGFARMFAISIVYPARNNLNQRLLAIVPCKVASPVSQRRGQFVFQGTIGKCAMAAGTKRYQRRKSLLTRATPYLPRCRRHDKLWHSIVLSSPSSFLPCGYFIVLLSRSRSCNIVKSVTERKFEKGLVKLWSQIFLHSLPDTFLVLPIGYLFIKI